MSMQLIRFSEIMEFMGRDVRVICQKLIDNKNILVYITYTRWYILTVKG